MAVYVSAPPAFTCRPEFDVQPSDRLRRDGRHVAAGGACMIRVLSLWNVALVTAVAASVIALSAQSAIPTQGGRGAQGGAAGRQGGQGRGGSPQPSNLPAAPVAAPLPA